MRVLITGGAGFIGSRLALILSGAGHDVTIIDNLSPQIHGVRATFPHELALAARCIFGDVRDLDNLRPLLAECEVLVHLAAETGTGQSMYAVERYAQVNLLGTANLMEIAANGGAPQLRKIVVASSRAIYGEGQYHCEHHGVIYPPPRDAESKRRGQFDPVCPACLGEITMMPTSEAAPASPQSFYGLTKLHQEQSFLMFGATLGIDAIALRYQNVFGPGQSLNNPYTGILAVFSNLAREGLPINVFEDGRESRDFVYVDDVVEATYRCVEMDLKGCSVFNVGSGVETTVLDVAEKISRFFASESTITVTGSFRVGDIRRNVADLTRIESALEFSPKFGFDEGLRRFLSWASNANTGGSAYEGSLEELRSRGLLQGVKQ